ncbi:22171_t:CDS:1, partial [Racocetra persica]
TSNQEINNTKNTSNQYNNILVQKLSNHNNKDLAETDDYLKYNNDKKN